MNISPARIRPMMAAAMVIPTIAPVDRCCEGEAVLVEVEVEVAVTVAVEVKRLGRE
jgi:hypothetical protein